MAQSKRATEQTKLDRISVEPDSVTGLATASIDESQQRARFQALYSSLTPAQRRGLDAIIASETLGGTIDELIDRHVFAHSTYYGSKGWYHQPKFNEALYLARVLHFDARMKGAVHKARETIVMAAPRAAGVLVAGLGGKDSLRAAESILNRADKSTADQARAAVVITGEDIAEAAREVADFEQRLDQGVA
jgi:hypothetical protein